MTFNFSKRTPRSSVSHSTQYGRVVWSFRFFRYPLATWMDHLLEKLRDNSTKSLPHMGSGIFHLNLQPGLDIGHGEVEVVAICNGVKNMKW